MDRVTALFTNPFLLTGVSSWMIAQVLKTVIHAIVHKQLDLRRMFGDGGMPSGHSATVTALAVLSGLVYGFGSYSFAIAAILMLIVCHDAKGVRQETGKQAILLEEMVRLFEDLSAEPLPDVRLKKFVGHTPTQVFAGIGIGAANAVLMYFLLF